MDITLDDILDEGILESAYAWLWKRRRNYPDHADVWNFRRHWQREIARLCRDLLWCWQDDCPFPGTAHT